MGSGSATTRGTCKSDEFIVAHFNTSVVLGQKRTTQLSHHLQSRDSNQTALFVDHKP